MAVFVLTISLNKRNAIHKPIQLHCQFTASTTHNNYENRLNPILNNSIQMFTLNLSLLILASIFSPLPPSPHKIHSIRLLSRESLFPTR